MNKLQIVNFEQAQALKEVGFDWPCNSCYYDSERFSEITNQTINYNTRTNYYSAPTVALALKWFRQIPVKNINTTKKYRFEFALSCDLTSSIYDYDKGVSYGINSYSYYEEDYDQADSNLLDNLLKILKGYYNEV